MFWDVEKNHIDRPCALKGARSPGRLCSPGRGTLSLPCWECGGRPQGSEEWEKRRNHRPIGLYYWVYTLYIIVYGVYRNVVYIELFATFLYIPIHEWNHALSRKRFLPRAWSFSHHLPEEKNWNLIEGQRDRLFLEYFIEPRIVSGPPQGLSMQK